LSQLLAEVGTSHHFILPGCLVKASVHIWIVNWKIIYAKLSYWIQFLLFNLNYWWRLITLMKYHRWL